MLAQVGCHFSSLRSIEPCPAQVCSLVLRSAPRYRFRIAMEVAGSIGGEAAMERAVAQPQPTSAVGVPPSSFEPSPAELTAMGTVGAIAEGCLMGQAAKASFLAAFGCEAGPPPRVLAAIREADVMGGIAAAKIGDAPLSPAARGMMETAWRASLLVTGVSKTRSKIQEEEVENNNQ